MKSTRVCFALLLIAPVSLLLAACRTPSADERFQSELAAFKSRTRSTKTAEGGFSFELPEAYHLTLAHRDLVQEAVTLVNIILKRRNLTLAVAVWPVDWESVKEDDVPVFVADGTGYIPCSVPSGYRGIIIDERLSTFFPLCSASGRPDPILPPSQVLALCLLHELGHIVNEDFKDKPKRPTQKEIESRADDFAAFTLLGSMSQNATPVERAVGKALATSLTRISVNLELKRNKALGGKTTLSKSDLMEWYADKGPTHVNPELRFVTLDHIVSMSAQSGSQYDYLYKHRAELIEEQ